MEPDDIKLSVAAPYRKAIAAVIGGGIIIGTAIAEAISDGAVSLAEGVTIVAAIGSAAGGYQARNEEAPAECAAPAGRG
jgi:hypothetical protein